MHIFLYTFDMQVNEKFPWDLEEGAFCDYTQNTLFFVVKDESWNEDQLSVMKKEPISIMFGTPMGLGLFLVEGGALDTCDFYFNIQECDEKEDLLAQKKLNVALVLLDQDNIIRFERSKILGAQISEEIVQALRRLNEEEQAPGEFDCNALGLMSACEPAELGKYARIQFPLK